MNLEPRHFLAPSTKRGTHSKQPSPCVSWQSLASKRRKPDTTQFSSQSVFQVVRSHPSECVAHRTESCLNCLVALLKGLLAFTRRWLTNRSTGLATAGGLSQLCCACGTIAHLAYATCLRSPVSSNYKGFPMCQAKGCLAESRQRFSAFAFGRIKSHREVLAAG